MPRHLCPPQVEQLPATARGRQMTQASQGRGLPPGNHTHLVMLIIAASVAKAVRSRRRSLLVSLPQRSFAEGQFSGRQLVEILHSVKNISPYCALCHDTTLPDWLGLLRRSRGLANLARMKMCVCCVAVRGDSTGRCVATTWCGHVVAATWSKVFSTGQACYNSSDRGFEPLQSGRYRQHKQFWTSNSSCEIPAIDYGSWHEQVLFLQACFSQ